MCIPEPTRPKACPVDKVNSGSLMLLAAKYTTNRVTLGHPWGINIWDVIYICPHPFSQWWLLPWYPLQQQEKEKVQMMTVAMPQARFSRHELGSDQGRTNCIPSRPEPLWPVHQLCSKYPGTFSSIWKLKLWALWKINYTSHVHSQIHFEQIKVSCLKQKNIDFLFLVC